MTNTLRQYGKMDDTLIYREWNDEIKVWSEWSWVGNSSEMDDFILDDLPQPSDTYISVADRLEGLS